MLLHFLFTSVFIFTDTCGVLGPATGKVRVSLVSVAFFFIITDV